MKKLIVLMIVLFPVTAWAGAHDRHTKEQLCSSWEQIGIMTLREIHGLLISTSALVEKNQLKEAAKQDDLRLDTQKDLAERAVIYSAFCK